MALKVSHLKGQRRIGIGMTTVKTITSKLGHHGKNISGFSFLMPTLTRTRQKLGFHSLHFSGIFLDIALRSKSALPSVKSCIDLSYLHDLLLIEHDTIGPFQNRCNRRVQ